MVIGLKTAIGAKPVGSEPILDIPGLEILVKRQCLKERTVHTGYVTRIPVANILVKVWQRRRRNSYQLPEPRSISNVLIEFSRIEEHRFHVDYIASVPVIHW